jgi:hypothetical protein
MIMDAKRAKAWLPIMQAFANFRQIQYRDKFAKDLVSSGDWVTINPYTTEFRIDNDNPENWRVKPEDDDEKEA